MRMQPRVGLAASDPSTPDAPSLALDASERGGEALPGEGPPPRDPPSPRPGEVRHPRAPVGRWAPGGALRACPIAPRASLQMERGLAAGRCDSRERRGAVLRPTETSSAHSVRSANRAVRTRPESGRGRSAAEGTLRARALGSRARGGRVGAGRAAAARMSAGRARGELEAEVAPLEGWLDGTGWPRAFPRRCSRPEQQSDGLLGGDRVLL